MAFWPTTDEQMNLNFYPKSVCLAALFLVTSLAHPARAGDGVDLSPSIDLGLSNSGPLTATAASRPYRVWMFRNLPGFIGDSADDGATPDAADGPDWLQLNAGNYNPYFDIRRPGDPGGVGYFRLTSQMQLFETKTTGCAIAVRAVTPAGREADGVDEGPTVVSPALYFCHNLEDGTGIQGFIGRNVRVDSLPSGPLHRSVEGGVAVQRPLITDVDGSSGVYFFVQTSCRYRYATPTTDVSPAVWEVLPGVHWRIYENCGLSGGVILPVGGERVERGMWQVTCWVQW
jgi:hypothetical protein